MEEVNILEIFQQFGTTTYSTLVGELLRSLHRSVKNTNWLLDNLVIASASMQFAHILIRLGNLYGCICQ